MDKNIRKLFDEIYITKDRVLQRASYEEILEITNKPVNWIYEVWDELISALDHNDNHVRSIAAEILSNLAKSDSEKRILKDFSKILEITKDHNFMTAKHALLSFWKIGLVNSEYKNLLFKSLEERFRNCISEKYYYLIRYNILICLKSLYSETNDQDVKSKALELIEVEEDLKQRKKYSSVWKKS